MKNYQTYNRPTNYQRFRRSGVLPGEYDRSAAWFEQHPFFYVRVARDIIIGSILFGLFAWGFGNAIDWQIDENNRRSCEMAFHNESVTHPLVRECSEFYQTGNIEYMR